MYNRIKHKMETLPSWIKLEANEKLVFCGRASTRVTNPRDRNAREQETVVLTDKRLITLCRLTGLRNATPGVTSIPLSQIQAVQTTALSWNALNILGIVIGFLFYIIPGIIGLVYMLLNVGPRVNVVTGILRSEVRFDNNCPELLDEFITALEKHTLNK